MTLYVNLRGNAYGAVCSPYLLEGDPESNPLSMSSVDWTAVPPRVVNKDVILATHGFSVSYIQGVRSLGRLEAQMKVSSSSEVYMGVLWPGDWIAPAVNYPFEDGVASKSGEFLGQFISRWLRSARSVSLISHSLGARVMLTAIQTSTRRIKRACLTAGAVNSGCLMEEFAAAAKNCDDIVTLSSMADWVLGLAYPPGDALADLLDPDHPPFEQALGRDGPTRTDLGWVAPRQIPDAQGFLHSDYLPPEDEPSPPFVVDPAAKWMTTARFMSAAVRGAPPAWPGWPPPP